MKSLRFILLTAIIHLVACHPVPEIEVVIHTCATPPEGRACAVCFAWDDTIYVVGGRTSNGQYTSTMMTYSQQSNEWSANRPTPLSARVNAVACRNGDAAYIGLGYAGGSIYNDETHLRDWWRYDAKHGEWTRLADFPSKKTVSAIAFANEEYVWVGFGFNGFGDELWRYVIATNTWEEVSQTGSWPKRLMSSVAANVDGRYFHGTGFRRHGYNDWWEFIADNQHWERRASVPGGGRLNATCSATEESCWVIGGWHYGDTLATGFHYSDILRYTPDNDRWTICGTIPCGAMENGVASGIGKTLYFGLGENAKGELHQKWYSIEE